MKKIILISTIIVLVSFIFSCDKEKEKAYYRFSQLDSERLLPYKEGQVLKFINQNNEERDFSIYAVNTSLKNLYTVGMGFFTSYAASYFYYDSKSITLIDSKMEQPFYINFNRWPLNTEIAKENIYTEYPSSFSGAIQYMRFWNVWDDAIIDYEQRKIEMTVSGKTYKNVFVLSSGSDSIIEYPWPDGTTQIRDVNVIFYDEIEGIIGFDDLNGNEWRLIN